MDGLYMSQMVTMQEMQGLWYTGLINGSRSTRTEHLQKESITVILNNYNLQLRIRNKAKFAFFAIMAGINIHLDSWINVE